MFPNTWLVSSQRTVWYLCFGFAQPFSSCFSFSSVVLVHAGVVSGVLRGFPPRFVEDPGLDGEERRAARAAERAVGGHGGASGEHPAERGEDGGADGRVMLETMVNWVVSGASGGLRCGLFKYLHGTPGTIEPKLPTGEDGGDSTHLYPKDLTVTDSDPIVLERTYF